MENLAMDLEIEELLANIATKAHLEEGVEGVRAILMTMYRFPHLKNKKVAQRTGIAIPTLAAVRSELKKASIIEDTTTLGSSGKQWVAANLQLTFDYDPVPENFALDENSPLQLALKPLKNILDQRPEPEFSLDQSRATYATVVKRVLLLLKRGDIEGRKIAFLGDDDATSIAVGLLHNIGVATDITVVDIDSRILDFLKEMAIKQTVKNVHLIPHNLREPFPDDLTHKFDVIVTDPPYTNQGVRLFLKRARQALKSRTANCDSVGKKCYLCFGNKPPKEMLQIQWSILDAGFTIAEMIPDFNHYRGASVLGQFSHLYHLQTARIAGYETTLAYHRPLYTREVKQAPIFLPTSVGHHFIGEFYGIPHEVLQDNTLVRQSFLDGLLSADLTLIDVYQHSYSPYGYSIIAILQASHAAIHTWPEHQYASCDIFLCEEREKGQQVLETLKTLLKPTKLDIHYIERGNEITSHEQ